MTPEAAVPLGGSPPAGGASSERPTWRLILSGPADAARNMAIDEVLLEGAAARPTVRLYRWDPPAFSLGRFQEALPAGLPDGIPRVRRPTGGGAIYHFAEVTFALVGSSRIPPLGGSRMAAYDRVNAAIAAALEGIGVTARPWSGTTAAPAAICFDGRSPTDLVCDGRKLVGSAQRRRRGCLLLHGVLPLERNPYAAASTCLREAAGREVALEEAEALLAGGFEEGLGIRLVPGRLTDEEEAAVGELRWEVSRRGPLRARTVSARRPTVPVEG